MAAAGDGAQPCLPLTRTLTLTLTPTPSPNPNPNPDPNQARIRACFGELGLALALLSRALGAAQPWAFPAHLQRPKTEYQTGGHTAELRWLREAGCVRCASSNPSMSPLACFSLTCVFLAW